MTALFKRNFMNGAMFNTKLKPNLVQYKKLLKGCQNAIKSRYKTY